MKSKRCRRALIQINNGWQVRLLVYNNAGYLVPPRVPAKTDPSSSPRLWGHFFDIPSAEHEMEHSMKRTWVGYSIFLSAAVFFAMNSAEGADRRKTDYLFLCASCHGAKGKGDGPVGKFFKKAPADLTILSAKNNGVFPSERTYEAIDGRREVGEHGTREMPVWGRTIRIFPKLGRAKFQRIVDYLATLQGK
jgi:mono/diheme cytochrome c family protein